VSTAWRIVGSLLVRDDDLYVEQAVRNVLGFCDELILIDHRSRDGTGAILERLASESPIPSSLHHVRDARESHDLVKGYAGETVWAFGFDGDELYDPKGLRRFRAQLLDGAHANHWQIRANVLHCTRVDRAAGVASGYASPPAPSISKLFNFSRIESWDGPSPERLNGTAGLRFKPGAAEEKFELNRTVSWEESPFRCLHLCFVRRSSRQRGDGARMNVPDRTQPRRAPVRWWRGAREAAGFPPRGAFKDHYRVGPEVMVSTAGFFD
jgi:hypothetical protein